MSSPAPCTTCRLALVFAAGAGALAAQSGVPLTLEPCVEMTPAEAHAREFVLHPLIAGCEMVHRTERVLRELDWKHDLAAACAESARRNRPIFWVQALGDLDGFA